MSLLIKKAGLFSTIQDLGRSGFRRFGVNPNGVMDRESARMANLLVGNDENEAVLEMHFPADEIVFEHFGCFVVGGADFGPTLDGRPIENWRVTFANNGSELRFAKKQSGFRAYLAVEGGFSLDAWLGSSATNIPAKIGGLNGRPLITGDRIGFRSMNLSNGRFAGRAIGPSMLTANGHGRKMRIVPGPEMEMLTAESEARLLEQTFRIAPDSNRMGYRLRGEALNTLPMGEMLSAAVTFGTIQLLPDGQLVILMADHQTTGGYPRIGNVIAVDLPALAQRGPGDEITFEAVSLADAEALYYAREREFGILKLGLRTTL